jgi:ribosomal protein S18 acetylase RimI-like enzyme
VVTADIRAESFDRRARDWNRIQARIVEIERECFGPGAFSSEELRRAFSATRGLAVVLLDGDRVVGYTYGERHASDTYYISNTAIAKSHQGRGLVKLLMERLYADARAAGARFIERDAAIGNGYADTLMRVHATEVIEAYDHDSPYGPQRFIRMRLP